jgi:hypothetical protein
MAKQYKVKDINNNGKIDGWEQGKYDAINNSATKMYKKEKSPMKMGYAMKMGSKEIYTPTNFNTNDATLIAQSPMMMDDPKKQKKHQSGVNYGYEDKKGGVRGGFNKAFKQAKEKGYDTFSFGYDKNKDGSIKGSEVKKYSTKTK